MLSLTEISVGSEIVDFPSVLFNKPVCPCLGSEKSAAERLGNNHSKVLFHSPGVKLAHLILYKYSETRNLIGQYTCRIR